MFGLPVNELDGLNVAELLGSALADRLGSEDDPANVELGAGDVGEVEMLLFAIQGDRVRTITNVVVVEVSLKVLMYGRVAFVGRTPMTFPDRVKEMG